MRKEVPVPLGLLALTIVVLAVQAVTALWQETHQPPVNVQVYSCTVSDCEAAINAHITSR